MTKKKPKVLIVGAFQRTHGDNRIGGLAFACSSLVNSELADQYDFVLIDSTIRSIKSRTGIHRLPSALYRISLAFWHMLFKRLHCVVCFSSHGNSFLEKGMIILLGRVLFQRTVLFPRSGHLATQLTPDGWRRRFARLTLRCTWRVFCQSRTWKDFYIDVLSNSQSSAQIQEKFQVIENWLPDEYFVDKRPVASSDGPEFVVGFYNRLERDKGIYDFLDAVAAANKMNPNIRGLVIGDGTEADAIAKLTQEKYANVVEFRGWLHSDEKEELCKLDMILFCSLAEGFPNSLLENLALKIPCVATRVGAVGDVIVDNHSGYLVDPADTFAMADRIVDLSRDSQRRESFAVNAYERAKMTNSLSTAVCKISEALG